MKIVAKMNWKTKRKKNKNKEWTRKEQLQLCFLPFRTASEVPTHPHDVGHSPPTLLSTCTCT